MYRHLWAEINLDALIHNIEQLKKYVPAEKFIGVIKANAYGHGAGMTAEILESCGVNKFAVSNVYEAIDLRSVIKDGEILILGNTDPAATKELFEKNITACVFDTESAERLNNAAKDAGIRLKCHLKIDSGMGRLGFNARASYSKIELEKQLLHVMSLENLNITGAFTHFATADLDGDKTGAFTNGQYIRFKECSKIISEINEKKGGKQLVFHSSNSSASLIYSNAFPSDLCRLGIVMYGLTPSKDLNLPVTLKPVMSLKAVVSQVKTIYPGDAISYGRTFVSDRTRKVATITAGYADGFMRGLSGKGYVLINKKKAKILGRICMDQAIVDVTDIEVKPQDTVTLFGEDLPIEIPASTLGTINYELVCAVGHRVPRVYIKDGKIIKELRYRSL